LFLVATIRTGVDEGDDASREREHVTDELALPLAKVLKCQALASQTPFRGQPGLIQTGKSEMP
jgi:hypothetical protein